MAGNQPVYMSCMSQNFRLFLVSNLSVQNLIIFSAHVSGVSAIQVMTKRERPTRDVLRLSVR